jgi:hypothetical protein
MSFGYSSPGQKLSAEGPIRFWLLFEKNDSSFFLLFKIQNQFRTFSLRFANFIFF